MDNGKTYRVTRAAFHVTVNDDGITPEGCNVSVFTEGNRGYHVRGECGASGLMGGHGWFGVDGLTQFECGGRLGQGYVEVS